MKGKIEIYYDMPLLAEYLELAGGKQVSEKDVQTAIEPLIHEAVEFHLNDCAMLMSGTIREMLMNQPVVPNSREVFRKLPLETLYIFFDEDEEEMRKKSNVIRHKKKQILSLIRHNGSKNKNYHLIGPSLQIMQKFDRMKLKDNRTILKSVVNKIENQEAPKEPCKVIFLDIDGVLNTEKYYNYLRDNGLDTDDYFGNLFSPEAVENLQRIIETTNAQIVISSSWRFAGIGGLRTMWNRRQLPGYIYDITSLYVADDFIREHMGEEDFDYTEAIFSTRELEISSWLRDHPETTNYVILDDLSSMKRYEANYVRINPKKGITRENTEQAITILNSK